MTMTTTGYQGIALVAMLLSLPLMSWGTTADLLPVTIAAAALLTIGALALTVLRYLHPADDEEE